MWWRSHALIAAFCAGLAALALAGCGFQPLYGGTTAGGAKLVEVMKAVEITPDSRPGRTEAAQRADLRHDRRRRSGADALQARHRHQGERDRPAGARSPATRPARSISSMPRSSWSTPPAARSCCKARALRGRPIIASRKSSPMFARATMPRTAPPAPSPTASELRSRLFSPTPPELPASSLHAQLRSVAFAMVVYKASTVAGFVRSPEPGCRAVLLYGPDAGLVAERAAALAQIFVKRGKGQTEIVRLDDRDLAEDPARLEVELKTAPMFASAERDPRRGRRTARRAVTQGAARRRRSDNVLIVEAGNLRPDSGLRKMFETHKSAAALPCYSDERSLLGLIDAELAAGGSQHRSGDARLSDDAARSRPGFVAVGGGQACPLCARQRAHRARGHRGDRRRCRRDGSR